MRYTSSLCAGLMLLSAGALQAAPMNYDIAYVDYGTGAGKTDNADLFNGATNLTSSFTADTIKWTRINSSQYSYLTFTPFTSFNLGGTTIDIAFKRIASDNEGGGSWDNTIYVANSRRFRMILSGNGTTNPAFDSAPHTSDVNIYRFVFGAQGQPAGQARVYVNDDPNVQTISDIYNGGSPARLIFNIETTRAAAQGFEIDWIGISSSVVDAPPVDPVPEPAGLSILGLGGGWLLARRRK